jgi:uncharacterized protein
LAISVVVASDDAGFEWDFDEDAENQRKHGVSFSLAERAFLNPRRVIARDVAHSESEERLYCFGPVGEGVLTVRFTYRPGAIRIIGAGLLAQGRAHL